MAVGANTNLVHRALIVSGLAVAVIVGVVAYQVRHAYIITVETQQREIQQLAQILEASTNTTFQSVELIVDHAAEEVLDQQALPEMYADLAERFFAIAQPWQFVYSVAYIRTDGAVDTIVVREADKVMRRALLGADFSKAPGFNFHASQDNPDIDAIYISQPVQDGLSLELVIAVTKGVYDQDGRFKGVVFVTVSLDTFAEIYAGLLPAKYKSVTLYRRDGIQLFRSVPGSSLGASFADRPLFTKRLHEAPIGTFRADAGEKPTEYLVAYRASPRYPIVITASATWDEVLANWKNDSRLLIISSFMGIMMILSLTWWLLQRIRAERAAQMNLQKSERSLAESQRLGGICHFERDMRTGVWSWNDDTFAAHGVTPETFTPSRESFLSLVVPEDRDLVNRSWGVRENPSPKGSMECRIAFPGGEIRHMRYNWQMLEDESGAPTRIFGVAQDVTAMRAAEDTIRDDETRLRDIIECSSDYIWESDEDGLVTFFAGQDAKRYGNIIGRRRSVFNYRNTSLSGGDISEMHQAIADRRRFRNLVVPATDEGGEVHWVRVSGNPRYDKAGRFVGYRGAGLDVTESRRQHHSEEQRRKTEALARLAGGLAHEINNLLQPILIYATVGGTTKGVPDAVRQYFGKIARASEHATVIVKNVLAFARQGLPKSDTLNVLSVVAETTELVGGMLPQTITLTVTEDSVDSPVQVDRTGLAQTLTNLINNAAEAMPKGGQIILRSVEVDVSSEAAKALAINPGRYCRLDVEDNGTGIGEDQVAKVFDPFYTTKAQGKGTGLGLSVVLGLARSWGGSVGVESKSGVGSRFSIYLPVAEIQLQAAQ